MKDKHTVYSMNCVLEELNRNQGSKKKKNMIKAYIISLHTVLK